MRVHALAAVDAEPRLSASSGSVHNIRQSREKPSVLVFYLPNAFVFQLQLFQLELKKAIIFVGNIASFVQMNSRAKCIKRDYLLNTKGLCTVK